MQSKYRMHTITIAFDDSGGFSRVWFSLKWWCSLRESTDGEPISLLYVPHRWNATELVARVLHATFVTAEKLGKLAKEDTSTSTPYFDWNS